MANPYGSKPASLAKYLARVRDRIERNSIPEPNSGCWIWTKKLNNKGHAVSALRGWKGRTTAASRVSYMAFICDPGVLNVLHCCDMPACVNPEHLFLGTQLDNIRDCIAKGRFRPGGVLQERI